MELINLNRVSEEGKPISSIVAELELNTGGILFSWEEFKRMAEMLKRLALERGIEFFDLKGLATHFWSFRKEKVAKSTLIPKKRVVTEKKGWKQASIDPHGPDAGLEPEAQD